MVNKKSLGAKDIFFPGPIAMIVAGEEEKYNIITVALMGLVNCEPPMISFTLSKSRYTCELIKKNKQVSINIASANNMESVDFCGLVSEREQDKLQITNLTLQAVKYGQIPIIKECCFHYIGDIIKEVEFDSMIMYIAEIKDTLIDEDKISLDNKIDIGKVNPLVYCTTIREYWSMGEKIGEGYREGLNLYNKIKNDIVDN